MTSSNPQNKGHYFIWLILIAALAVGIVFLKKTGGDDRNLRREKKSVDTLSLDFVTLSLGLVTYRLSGVSNQLARRFVFLFFVLCSPSLRCRTAVC